MKSFRKVINGHTYHVTCSWRLYWITVTLHEDGVAVVRKRAPVPLLPAAFKDRTENISFERVTASVTFENTAAKSCVWSFADCTTEE